MAQDYTWLQATVARWIRRSDLTADIPNFIQLAELRISGDLTARLQTNVTTLSTTAGAPTVTLPSDLNSVRTLANPNYGTLAYLTPEAFDARYTDQTPGLPRHYTILGSVARLGPAPDAVYALECVYLADVAPLASAVGGVNWLITQHPEVYLAATMCEACTFVRDTAQLQIWEAKYEAAVTSLNKTDWNAPGALTVRADARNP